MTRSEIAEARREFIEKRKSILDKKISAIERKIYEVIFDKIIAELDKKDGRIAASNGNIDIANSIDRVFREIQNNEYLEIIKGFGSDLQGVLALNDKYYEIIEEDNKRLERVAKEVNSIMRKRLGLTKENGLIKDGYLDRLITDDALKRKVKNATLKAVTSNTSYSDFNTEIKTMVQGNEKTDGELKRYFNTFAFDTYNNLNRTTAKLYATKLNLRAFVYAGGKIDSSRCFCEERNGKVFTTDEAQEWKNILNDDCGPLWNESKDGTYDPLVEMGGYNCRHTADFISNSMAIRMRPDLEGKI